MSFKKGDKVKCINRESIDGSGRSSLTVGNIYTVVRDQSGNSTVRVVGDDESEFGFYAQRFVLVPAANGVDANGNVTNFTVDDLKPFMRAKMKNGETAIVSVDEDGVTALTFPGSMWTQARFSAEGCSGTGYYIVEVFGSTASNRAVDFSSKGKLLWRATDVEAIAEADKAIADAEAALATLRASRAAL
jgi:hypothetical protein